MWGVCPNTIKDLIEQMNENTTLHLSAIEVYFDDCFDLLANKIKIPIAGFGSGVKAHGTMTTQNVEMKNKKWVSPYAISGVKALKPGEKKQSDFDAKGMAEKEIKSKE